MSQQLHSFDWKMEMNHCQKNENMAVIDGHIAMATVSFSPQAKAPSPCLPSAPSSPFHYPVICSLTIIPPFISVPALVPCIPQLTIVAHCTTHPWWLHLHGDLPLYLLPSSVPIHPVLVAPPPISCCPLPPLSMPTPEYLLSVLFHLLFLILLHLDDLPACVPCMVMHCFHLPCIAISVIFPASGNLKRYSFSWLEKWVLTSQGVCMM